MQQCRWDDHTKWNKSEKRGKYHMISLTCGRHNMAQINFTKQKWIHRHREVI